MSEKDSKEGTRSTAGSIKFYTTLQLMISCDIALTDDRYVFIHLFFFFYMHAFIALKMLIIHKMRALSNGKLSVLVPSITLEVKRKGMEREFYK